MGNVWQELAHTSKPFLALAPLDGVTNFVFREIVAETAKPDVLFTEFTNVDALVSKGYERTIPRLAFSEKQRPIIAQIWGTDPKNFCTVGKLIKELGFDGVDINMGCPDRAVMKIGSGASLIQNPTLAGEIISTTREGAHDLPVSVKTRIGINTVVTEIWVKYLLEQKLDALTVHGRTAKELSKVPAHWDEIATVVKLRDQIFPDTIIIGNGDIKSREEAKHAHEAYGVDGVMIGRGIFANPWIFEKSSTKHTYQESLLLLLKHTRLFCDTYPHSRSFNVMKKFFKIYIRAFPGADELKKHLMATKTLREVEAIIVPYL